MAHSSASESGETLHLKAPPRVWSREEEYVVLKGMLEYKKRFGSIPTSSSLHVESLHSLISGSLSMEASINQLSQKIRGLRKKHRRNAHRKPSNKKFFQLSNKVWGHNDHKSPSKALFVATCTKINQSGGDMERYCIEEGLKLVEGPKRAKLEERWAKLRNAEVELAVERDGLIYEQAMLLFELDGNKEDDDQD